MITNEVHIQLETLLVETRFLIVIFKNRNKCYLVHLVETSSLTFFVYFLYMKHTGAYLEF